MSTEKIFYPIKKILLPTDGSEYSLKAAKYAVEIASKHGSKITLLHVMQLNLPDATSPIKINDLNSTRIVVEDQESAIERAKNVMKKTREIIEKAGIKVETEFYSYGNVSKIILETAKNFDLIVIGHKGLTGLKHIMLGSVAEAVSRNAPCPVLIVR